MFDSKKGKHSAHPSDAGGVDTTSTRVISNNLHVDGVKFAWWAVGEKPALVTVRSTYFGSAAEFTTEDPRAFAERLARNLLTTRLQEAEAKAKAAEKKTPDQP